MLDSIGAPQIVDIAIGGAVLFLAAAGFWRGLLRELFISASLLLAYLVTLSWAARWGSWIGGERTRLSTAEGQYLAYAGTIVLTILLLGYVGSMLASLPPADLPARVGGAVLGAANALFLITILIVRARQLLLDPNQRQTLADTRVGDWLSGNLDWVLLALAGTGFGLFVGGLMNRRRRLAVITMAGPPPVGASGFRVRRSAPLAPEAEKIDRSPMGSPAAIGGWPEAAGMADTVPITRVSDPSRHTDRPAGARRPSEVAEKRSPFPREQVMRCVSCGERVTEDDRYCPRCGRLLISG